jgi:acetyl esterase
MAILLFLVLLIAAAAALLVGVANYWANTPHGRIKPIFALMFRLAPILDPVAAKRGVGAAEMDTPERTAQLRSELLVNTARLAKPVDFTGNIEDRRLPGGPGGDLPLRIYSPETQEGSDPLPLLVYFHGGAFVVGSPDYTDVATRILAITTPAVVVSVDYRMAPEHPLPAAVEDCEFAVSWCFENADSLGARPGPVVVAGDSAGGNLCAVVAQRDLAAGRGRIGLQVLIYPWVDAACTDRASEIAFGSGYGLSTRDLEDCLRRYLPPRTDRTHPDVSPLHAKSLVGLPPAYLVTAGFDPLRDQGIEYAEALRAAGVEVRHVHEAALPHGFITMTRLCSEAQTNLEAIGAEIRGMAWSGGERDVGRAGGGAGVAHGMEGAHPRSPPPR